MIDLTALQQFAVCADAGHLAFIEHHDAVRIHDRGHTLRHDHHDGILHFLLQLLAQLGIRRKIQRGKGIVIDIDLRAAHQGAGDGQSLLLSAGHIGRPLHDALIEAMRLLLDERGRLRHLSRMRKLRLIGILLAEADIVGDAAAEQYGLLGHIADLGAQLLQVIFPHILLIDAHRSIADIIKAGHQRHERALARTGRADERDRLAFAHREAHILEHRLFPIREAVIAALSKCCDDRRIIGNKAASGTEILDELAEREIENGELIVYTSADSVLQICGNEETMGLETLYHYCEIARELTMKDEWKVGRVIARPYVGKKKGEFVRTANRHDYAVKPTGKTVLNAMQEAGYDVISIGKINDIFCGEGITESLKSKSSVHGMEQTIETAGKDFTGLCFVNLVDFDALWGHRRNPEGYGKEIEKFDVNLGKLLEQLKDDDLLLITADHGNDPTYTGTDHTREQVPLLAYSPSMKESGLQETKDTFAVIGASVAENFGVEMPEGTIGTSILPEWK